MDSLGQRIRLVREDVAKLNQTAFGALFNVGIAKMNRIENGHCTPDADFILSIWRQYGTDLNWLLTGQETSTLIKQIKNSTPLMKSPDLEIVEGSILLPDLPKGCQAVKITDDDMLPIIRPGDIVIFNADMNKVREGSLVLIESRWGEVKVRRYSQKDDKLLFAEDPDIPPLKANEDIRIVGQVVQVVRQLNV